METRGFSRQAEKSWCILHSTFTAREGWGKKGKRQGETTGLAFNLSSVLTPNLQTPLNKTKYLVRPTLYERQFSMYLFFLKHKLWGPYSPLQVAYSYGSNVWVSTQKSHVEALNPNVMEGGPLGDN